MATRFAEWILHELEVREWSQSDLARNSNISTSQITRILNGQRNAGEETVRAFAKALKLPPEQVFRAAGLLPPKPEVNELIEQIIHETHDMPEIDQQEVLAYIRMKNNLRKKQQKK